METHDGTTQTGEWNPCNQRKSAPWKSTVSAPTCALCTKPVFPAEEVIGAGQKYHKLCLKCGNSYSHLHSFVLSFQILFQLRAILFSTRATSTSTTRKSIAQDAIVVSSDHKEVRRMIDRLETDKNVYGYCSGSWTRIDNINNTGNTTYQSEYKPRVG